VDDAGDDAEPVPGFDLASFAPEQIVVAVVHHPLQPQQGADGVVDVRADEHVGDVPPLAKLDAFAVDQTQAAVGGQGEVGDEVVDQAGFPGAGFAADQDVAVDDVEVDGLSELVDAQKHGVEDGQDRADG